MAILSISQLKKDLIGSEVSVKGVIVKVGDLLIFVKKGVYVCHRCGHMIEVESSFGDIKEPKRCPEEDGGCGRTIRDTSFELDYKNSDLIDYQPIELAPLEKEGYNVRLKGFLTGPLIGSVRKGEEVIATGTLLLYRVRREGIRKKFFGDIFEFILEVHSINYNLGQ